MKINAICFDSEAKEIVKITNLKPPTKEQLLKDSSLKDTDMLPFEAIAIRIFPPTKAGKPKIAFTYRKVNYDMLRELGDVPGTNSIDYYLDPTCPHKEFEFIGRV